MPKQRRQPSNAQGFHSPGGDVSRPSLGQQVAGEAKQVEFTLTRRGRDFILRLGERVAYRGARGGPKSCRLGRVTQVDQARAQVGVHRYLPEVSSGVRIKWALAYLKEDGSMTSSEGSRPCIETVSVKEVITKVDLNRDGVLAASSARKLDKAGYLLQERTALVAPRESACGGLDLAAALSNVLVSEEGPSAPASAELLSVSRWAETHLPKDCLDILEVSWGEPVLSRAARLKGYSVGPAIIHGGKAYAVQWDLLKGTHVAAVVGALDLLKPRLLVVTLLGKGVPHSLYQFVVDRAVQRREYLAVCFTSEAVKAHWDKSSAARAKLANRHRRTVDLKPGDRVVWNAPKARSEGAGRVPWKPGLTGPWRVKDVRGHRLTLEPVPDVPGGTFSGAKGPMEAHAEDCILVPPDAEAAQPREPIVFEDEDHEALNSANCWNWPRAQSETGSNSSAARSTSLSRGRASDQLPSKSLGV